MYAHYFVMCSHFSPSEQHFLSSIVGKINGSAVSHCCGWCSNYYLGLYA